MNTKTKDISYEKYRADVEKYIQKDNREINYQNRIVIPLLEEHLSNNGTFDVVDVSTMYKNWNRREWHDRSKYAGDYTPDILLAKQWNIKNKGDKEIEYLCLIEVKTPTASRRSHAISEVEEYCQKVPCVILTDCITWEFYKNGVKDSEVLSLEKKESCQPVCKRGDNKTIDWKIPEVEGTETDFDRLCEKLKDFVVGVKSERD